MMHKYPIFRILQEICLLPMGMYLPRDNRAQAHNLQNYSVNLPPVYGQVPRLTGCNMFRNEAVVNDTIPVKKVFNINFLS